MEYHTTYDAPSYVTLMRDLEQFVDTPGDKDVPLSAIFPQAAVDELAALMRGVGWEGVDETLALWQSDLAARPVVSGFLKDKSLGAKRFMSMPDRFTNTINIIDGPAACRPAVINNYVGDLTSFEGWWSAWKTFVFEAPLTMQTKKGVSTAVPYKLLGKISRAKYPALSEEEERISQPMQALCLALFDASMMHMMNTLSPSGEWLAIKRRLCDALFVGKQARTLEVLSGPAYANCDCLFLQEVAANFVPKLMGSGLGETHHVLAPTKLDAARDQNSVLLLKKATFPNSGAIAEVSDAVRAAVGEGAGQGIMDGDVMAVTATDFDNRPYFFVSFHGDTNGLQSAPLLEAVVVASASASGSKDPLLVAGLDANVHAAEAKGFAYVKDWTACYRSLGLTSCWGDEVEDVKAARTTYNARTFVQPQLQKAVRLAEFEKGDCNPKDYIVFSGANFTVSNAGPRRDNTGEGGNAAPFVETPIPSLVWPSDHAAVFADLVVKR